jgi:small subunit ribosomal protein S35
MIRIAAWEMPRLSALAKPYDYSKDRGILRWRYTTYMGELHPAAHKVVVQFKPSELPDMTEAQRLKLCKLAGPRYNPLNGLLKMSCESFDSQAQNKRHLGHVIKKLIAEAKDPNADSFEDVPLDTRHVAKHKPRPKFPEHWLLTEERKAELEAKRKRLLLEEGERTEKDQIVSGLKAIKAAREAEERKKLEQPLMAEASRQGLAKGGRQGRVGSRR